VSENVQEVTQEEFDFLLKKQWINGEGRLTALGKVGVGNGSVHMDSIIYRVSQTVDSKPWDALPFPLEPEGGDAA